MFMHIHKLLRITKGITLIEMAPSPYIFIISIGPEDMNKYARFDKIPSKTLKDIKETKRYKRTDGRMDGRTDNVKTVYPPTNTVCGGYNYDYVDRLKLCFWRQQHSRLMTPLTKRDSRESTREYEMKNDSRDCSGRRSDLFKIYCQNLAR